MRRVPKPWGEEIIFAETDRYVGKILLIRRSESLSLQYHRRKDETLYLNRGSVRLSIQEGEDMVEKPFRPGDSCHIPPGTRHRLLAEEDSEIFEVSTPDLDDVVLSSVATGGGSKRPGAHDQSRSRGCHLPTTRRSLPQGGLRAGRPGARRDPEGPRGGSPCEDRRLRVLLDRAAQGPHRQKSQNRRSREDPGPCLAGVPALPADRLGAQRRSLRPTG